MKWFLTAFFFLSTLCLHAQLFQKILDKTKEKTERKISDKISDKVSDGASKPIDDASFKKGEKPAKESSGTIKTQEASQSEETKESSANPGSPIKNVPAKASLSTYSKFDFVPGDKIIVLEDFSQDNIGDFPDKWNTNSSGELVQVDGEEGKWLKISKKGAFIPDFIKSLPDNFTMEFDLICNEDFSFYSTAFTIGLLSGGEPAQAFKYDFIQSLKRSGITINLHPHNAGSDGGNVTIKTFDAGAVVIDNNLKTTQFNAVNGNTKIRVSLWRQKQRIRMYLNEEKVLDLPRAFAAGKEYNLALFELGADMSRDNDQYLLSNLKLAVGAPDTRNKLITEGKFVTTGILFDVNSDKIKPESFGVLKEIASVLKENATVKIKIVGHTDSDGEDKANLELSKKRAAAVKVALATDFAIATNRIETDGMGEKQPVTNNSTTEAKANNRRVEFIRL